MSIDVTRLLRLATALVWAAMLTGGEGNPAYAAREPDRVVAVTVESADRYSYKELEFDVPAQTEGLTIELDNGGDKAGTVFDVGLFDPDRFRGWSGHSRRRFSIGPTVATPSYLAGPIVPGRWRLVVGVTKISAATRSRFEARIFFHSDHILTALGRVVPRAREAGWYRGDLHLHSGHSDGECKSQSGRIVPCPLFKTFQAAAERKLDFIGLTEHNTVSHLGAAEELYPYFDDMVIVPGQEITTYKGHISVLGIATFVAYGLDRATPDWKTVQDIIVARGGLVVINHPIALCAGCAWDGGVVDYKLIDAVEVLNGGSVRAYGGEIESPGFGVPFWEGLLDRGYRPAAIASSDNHDAQRPASEVSSVGRPLTALFLKELSWPGIAKALRGGCAFIDTDGMAGRSLQLTASSGSASARMGDELIVLAGAPLGFEVTVVGVPEPKVEVVTGTTRSQPPVTGNAQAYRFALKASSDLRWVRVNVRDKAGRLVLIGNPVFVTVASTAGTGGPGSRPSVLASECY